jgi:hypothetical protein
MLATHHCLIGCMQVKPALSYAGSSVTTLDFLADTFSNKNQGEPRQSAPHPAYQDHPS